MGALSGRFLHFSRPEGLIAPRKAGQNGKKATRTVKTDRRTVKTGRLTPKKGCPPSKNRQLAAASGPSPKDASPLQKTEWAFPQP